MPQRSYHHGDLRRALVEEAVAVTRAQGADALALRDLARRVGVSHNAAYRHFADRHALVGAVAAHAMAELVRAMRARLDADEGAAPPVRRDDPVVRARRRLAGIGRAYVEFAIAEPGLFRVAFSRYSPVTAEPDEHASPADADPYALLTAALDDLVRVGLLADDARPGAEEVCWSAVHGFASLSLDGPLAGAPVAERERALDHVLVAVDRSLAATTGTVADPGDVTAGW